MLWNARLGAVVLVCWAGLACSPQGRTTDNNSTTCDPGATVVCTCSDGAQGEATCNAGGTLYGVCQCALSSSCDGGSEESCLCSDGGTGVAACLTDGGAGSCVCDGTSTVCTPGATEACVCGSGEAGDQTCNGAGSGYGSCVCGGTCTPGMVADCTCGDGGPGQQTCNGGGTAYGECACDTPAVCTPDAVAACACADGGTGEETCNGAGTAYGECVCHAPVVCTPAMVASCTCGDGGPGEETCNGGGTGYGTCACDAPPACTASALIASGSVTASSGSINYSTTSVAATFQNFLGTGSGCLGTASLTFSLEDNECALQLQLGAVIGGSGGITSASLNVDANCAGLIGVAAGSYSSTAGYGLTSLLVTPAIPNATMTDVCLNDATVQFGGAGITLVDSGGAFVTISLAGLTLAGDLYSTGSASATCYTTASCGTGYTESAQDWCTPTAGCGTGMHNGGSGTCVPDGTCSTGYHSDGTGNCVALGQCAAGYQNGGDGTCVTDGTCSTGYHSDGTGNCVAAGQCAAGYHDGGDGSCVPLGDCVSGDHDGGDGTCLPTGLCSSGYELTNTGTCVSTTGCATGDHDGGDGTCVPDGTCSTGYQNGGDGVCQPTGTCSAGYHNGGSGVCVATGTCSVGYTLGTGGVCMVVSELCVLDEPIADAGSAQSVVAGQTVTLSGADSTQGLEPISTYTWTFVSVPAGSAASLVGNGVSATFVPEVDGTYVVQLVVSDILGCVSAPATVSVSVGPATSNAIRLEMNLTWAEAWGDADLHYLAPGGTFYNDGRSGDFGVSATGGTDCDWENTNPSWGTVADNPLMNGDSGWAGGTTGEITNQPEVGENPTIVDGTYTAVAHYYCSRDDATDPLGTTDFGAITAVMHVYVNGVQEFTASQVMNQRDEWPAVQIVVSGNGTQVSFTPLTVVTSVPVDTIMDVTGMYDLGGCTSATN